jgi:hypothetical protein
LQGCQKDPSSIGLGLRDPDNILNAVFTDTVSLNTYSIVEDTLNTTNLLSNFLGFIKDPVFGTTVAGIFTQFVPEGNNVNLGVSPQLDSIVLTLRYAGGFYGDTLNPFVIKVYQLNEDILANETYYQNKMFDHTSENLTYDPNFQCYPKPKTKVKVDTVKVDPHLRIRLDDNLGNLFLQNISQMTSNATFKNFFKGLYICVEPLANDGSLVNFNLTSAITGMQLYYRNDSTAKQLRFYIKSKETVRVSNYKHDYAAGELNFVNQIVYKDTTLGKNTLYLQSMGGVKTKIYLPNIKLLKEKKWVINKAELVITNIGENLSLFPPPPKLNIQGINKKGEFVIMPDAATTYFGGTYDATRKEYRFRLTKYLQSIILRDDYEPYIYLVTDKAAADASRLILSGSLPTAPASRLRLDVYYTEY